MDWFIILLNPIRVVWYIIAMASVGFHLTHAVQSVFQTFGLSNDSYLKKLQSISIATGVLIALGFAAIPVYINIIDRF